MKNAKGIVFYDAQIRAQEGLGGWSIAGIGRIRKVIAAMKKTFVSVYARFTLKNPPEGYRGIRGEDWNFGKTTEMSLHDLSLLVLSRLTEFYLTAMPEKSIDEINGQIKRLSETLTNCGIKED